MALGLLDGLDELHDLLKGLLVTGRDLGQRFPVQLDLRFVERINEPGIRHPAGAARRVDTRVPKRAEMALALLAVAGGEGHRAGDGLFRGTEQVAASAHETLGSLEYLFLPFF
jgi:hypothetical protein